LITLYLLVNFAVVLRISLKIIKDKKMMRKEAQDEKLKKQGRALIFALFPKEV